MPKKFLTVSEVAKIIGVTPLTVRNWDKAGRLTAHRNPFNNYRMYRVEDVEDILRRIDNSKGKAPRVQLASSKPKVKPKNTPRKLTISEE